MNFPPISARQQGRCTWIAHGRGLNRNPGKEGAGWPISQASGAGREICCMTAPGTAGRKGGWGAIHSHFPVPRTPSQHSLASILAGREGGRQDRWQLSTAGCRWRQLKRCVRHLVAGLGNNRFLPHPPWEHFHFWIRNGASSYGYAGKLVG